MTACIREKKSNKDLTECSMAFGMSFHQDGFKVFNDGHSFDDEKIKVLMTLINDYMVNIPFKMDVDFIMYLSLKS